ncbi:hypothetical protein HB943_02250 [Listeria weihenstephanensis]|uniref:Phage protein n=1 Tax=Listeria weihenstephanensis TaxID=1006155 RepID=A0A841Z4L6_9LIST|nr:tail assembly chaperone [Listeria weihenstephanensis]MBC1499407.1 hypothetical protein [Listeria weihenstephanensis]
MGFTVNIGEKACEVKANFRMVQDVENNLSTIKDGVNNLDGAQLLYMSIQNNSINALVNIIQYGINRNLRPSLNEIEDFLEQKMQSDEDIETMFSLALGCLQESGFFKQARNQLIQQLEGDEKTKEMAEEFKKRGAKGLETISKFSKPAVDTASILTQ